MNLKVLGTEYWPESLILKGLGTEHWPESLNLKRLGMAYWPQSLILKRSGMDIQRPQSLILKRLGMDMQWLIHSWMNLRMARWEREGVRHPSAWPIHSLILKRLGTEHWPQSLNLKRLGMDMLCLVHSWMNQRMARWGREEVRHPSARFVQYLNLKRLGMAYWPQSLILKRSGMNMQLLIHSWMNLRMARLGREGYLIV